MEAAPGCCVAPYDLDCGAFRGDYRQFGPAVPPRHDALALRRQVECRRKQEGDLDVARRRVPRQPVGDLEALRGFLDGAVVDDAEAPGVAVMRGGDAQRAVAG